MSTLRTLRLPRPAPFELDLQRHAEERPDQDDDREHARAPERRRDRDGANDVRGDQELEPEQDRPSDGVAIVRVALVDACPIASETSKEND